MISDPEAALRKLVKCRHIYIAETPRCGFGIFAARPFAGGETIVVDEDGDYYDAVMTREEALARGLDINQDCFQIGADLYLPPNGNIDDIINHSCAPTTGLVLTEAGYRMIAVCDIRAGDELTYDYSTYIAGSHERMDCLCGARTCRGVIGSFATLPADLRRRYLDLGIVGAFAQAEVVGAAA
jgi:hypothetical protein